MLLTFEFPKGPQLSSQEFPCSFPVPSTLFFRRLGSAEINRKKLITNRTWKQTCNRLDLGLSPHGGKLGMIEQIQFLLGHASVHTTEHYLGCKQKLRHAVNDNLGLEDI
jgi:integrase